jgi:2-C-methyl-D-erythritol 2,4-cyclodiphosphate synthase
MSTRWSPAPPVLGVTIPFERGLEGHSDADVLLHAICNAVLGAIGAGDIGMHFPDRDPAYKDADSRVLLRRVWAQARDAGYTLANVDATVIAQAPKLSPYVPNMVANIAADLAAPVNQVNVKATTTERLGFPGAARGSRRSGDGIAGAPASAAQEPQA